MKPKPLPPAVDFGEEHHRCETTGKTRYGSQHAATKNRSKRRNKGARMRAYRCEHCHGWHLTTQASSRDEFKRPRT